MEQASEVHLQSWHRDRFYRRKDASAQAVILMKRTSDTYRIAC
jgi:hypothetical protein